MVLEILVISLDFKVATNSFNQDVMYPYHAKHKTHLGISISIFIYLLLVRYYNIPTALGCNIVLKLSLSHLSFLILISCFVTLCVET